MFLIILLLLFLYKVGLDHGSKSREYPVRYNLYILTSTTNKTFNIMENKSQLYLINFVSL